MRPGAPGTLEALFDYLEDMKHWMVDGFLKLSKTKTAIVVFGPPKNVASNLGPSSVYLKPYGRNLVVLFNPDLKFE